MGATSRSAWWAVTLQQILRFFLGVLLAAWAAPPAGRPSMLWILVVVVAAWTIHQAWRTIRWIHTGQHSFRPPTARSALFELAGCCMLVTLVALWRMLEPLVLAMGLVLVAIAATDYWLARTEPSGAATQGDA